MDKKEICFLLLVLSFILSIQIYVLPNSCKMEALESWLASLLLWGTTYNLVASKYTNLVFC